MSVTFTERAIKNAERKAKVLELLSDPVVMRRTNGWFAIFWIAMIPVSIALGLLSSVTYVSGLSIWALVSGHWSAWQAARVEVAQQKQERRDTEGIIARRVIKELRQKTGVLL